jgi:hypothetical protein
MAVKIELNYNRFKVTFEGLRYSISVPKEQLMNTIAHYYVMKEHDKSTCPVYADLEKKYA